MKVTTEACLFGAWVVESFNKIAFSNAIDIGTGTGLLALMLAQETVCNITAIELDPEAARQAGRNFEASSWKDNLEIIEGDITEINTRKKFNLVISNPPFYEKSLASPDKNINLARHDSGLGLKQLFEAARKLLENDGIFYLLFPSARLASVLNEAAACRLYLLRQASVKQSEQHGVFREMLALSPRPVMEVLRETINIREKKEYSTRFIGLLENFYLNF